MSQDWDKYKKLGHAAKVCYENREQGVIREIEKEENRTNYACTTKR